MFFRDVGLERLPTLIWACSGLHFGELGAPSWGHVGTSWASNGDLWLLLDTLGRLELILNFTKSMLESYGYEKWRPGVLPTPFSGPPAMILEGLRLIFVMTF